MTALFLLALHLGIKRGVLTGDRQAELVKELARLPELLGELVADEPNHEILSHKYSKYSNFLYLGRGINHPLAMEGALKLKEISYIHAEGYPAGEMKHGPISLIDEGMPVVALIPKDELYEKMLSNVNEIKARGGTVIALATEGDSAIAESADDVVYVPTPSFADADPHGGPAPAVRVPRRGPPRLRRRSAAKPGQVRHRRVAHTRTRLSS